MNRLTLDKQARLFALLVEGNSMRGITRLEDVTLNTVLRNSVWMGEACQKFHDTHVRDLKITNLQADELTSIIYAKDKNLPEELKDSRDFGGMWTWLAISPESYFVPSWHIGKREMIDAFTFAHDLAGRIPGRVQITTDQLRHYYTAFDDAFGDRADYATIQKFMDEAEKTPDGKFEQPKLKGNRKASVRGTPDPDLITTTTAEVNNLRIRMSSRRYMRRANGFSRKIRNKRAAMALHFVHHNFCRIAPPIRVTPAMQIGLADHVIEIEELIEMINVPATMEHYLLNNK